MRSFTLIIYNQLFRCQRVTRIVGKCGGENDDSGGGNGDGKSIYGIIIFVMSI